MLITKGLLWLKTRLAAVNAIGREAHVASGASLQGCHLSGRVRIGVGCRLKECQLSGDISIGRYTSIWGPNTELRSAIHPIHVGSFCSIAKNVTIQEYNHNAAKRSTYYIGKNLFHTHWENERVSKGEIHIGHDVWIGTQSVILSGAHIGNGAIIAANSVVTGAIPAYAIAGGSPARVIRFRFPPEAIQALEAEAWWNWPVEKIKAHQSLFEGNHAAGT